jgi:hypothetical protein
MSLAERAVLAAGVVSAFATLATVAAMLAAVLR